MRAIATASTAMLLIGVCHVSAQQVSLGPQLTGLGVGGSASVRLADRVSVSADFGFVPVGDITFDADDIEYSINPDVIGGFLGVNIHPLGNNFSIGAGLFLGGYSGDASSKSLTATVQIGNGEYEAAQIGSLVGEIDWKGPAPAVMLGLRGKGFNVGLGIAFTGPPDFDIDATGPIRNDPSFRNDLDIEIEDARDDVEIVTFLPLFRIGYEFGVR